MTFTDTVKRAEWNKRCRANRDAKARVAQMYRDFAAKATDQECVDEYTSRAEEAAAEAREWANATVR